jgi:hypothetical protein
LLPAVAGSDATAAIATPPSEPTPIRDATPAWDSQAPAYPVADDTTLAVVDRDVDGVISPERDLIYGSFDTAQTSGPFASLHAISFPALRP